MCEASHRYFASAPLRSTSTGLNREINAAEQRQRENTGRAGAAIEQHFYKDRIRDLTQELEKERQRSKNLVAHIAVMEANAARLGLDPEEMHRPLLKPCVASRGPAAASWLGQRGAIRSDTECPEEFQSTIFTEL
jgi:hypothetical protein